MVRSFVDLVRRTTVKMQIAKDLGPPATAREEKSKQNKNSIDESLSSVDFNFTGDINLDPPPPSCEGHIAEGIIYFSIRAEYLLYQAQETLDLIQLTRKDLIEPDMEMKTYYKIANFWDASRLRFFGIVVLTLKARDERRIHPRLGVKYATSLIYNKEIGVDKFLDLVSGHVFKVADNGTIYEYIAMPGTITDKHRRKGASRR